MDQYLNQGYQAKIRYCNH